MKKTENMKKYSALLLCLLLFISCGKEQQKEAKFQDEKGRFKVDFPTKPEIMQGTNHSFTNKIVIHSFKSTPKNDVNKSYELYYIDFPKSFTDTLSIERTYDFFNDFQMENIISKATESMGVLNIKILGYTGREFSWHNTETKMISKVHSYLVKNRVYVLTVTANEENRFNKAAQEFLESFELVNTEPFNASTAVVEKKAKTFTVTFPGPTEKRETEAPTNYGNGKIIAEAYQAKVKNAENVVLSVITLEYPDDITKTDDFNLENFYDELVETSLNNKQSKLISREEISKNGIKGIKTKEQLNVGGGTIILTQWAFLKRNILYSIQVGTTPENDKNAAMLAFYDSFEFVEL
jgi:hypothetical protein